MSSQKEEGQCVSDEMRKKQSEIKAGKLTKKQALGKSFGICRGKLGLKKRDFHKFEKVMNDFISDSWFNDPEGHRRAALKGKKTEEKKPEPKKGGVQGSIRNKGFKYGSIEAVNKAIPASDDRFITIYQDEGGTMYKLIQGSFHEATGPATFGAQGFSKEQLFEKGDISVEVYESKNITPKGTSGSIRVTDKLFHAEIIKSPIKKTPEIKGVKGKVSKTNTETISDIQGVLKKKGFKQDRFGNWKNKSGNQRIKFSTTSFRIESKGGGHIGPYGRKSPIKWSKEGGGFYKDYKIEEGKLIKLRKDFTLDFRMDEIDIWIEKGYLDDFLDELSNQDLKIDEVDITTEREGEARYAVSIRAFSKYDIPKGLNWDLKNVFRGEGKLEKIAGKGKGWHGDPEGHSKAAKKGKKDFELSIEATLDELTEEQLESLLLDMTTQDIWKGNPQGHREAALKGWRDRKGKVSQKVAKEAFGKAAELQEKREKARETLKAKHKEKKTRQTTFGIKKRKTTREQIIQKFQETDITNLEQQIKLINEAIKRKKAITKSFERFKEERELLKPIAREKTTKEPESFEEAIFGEGFKTVEPKPKVAPPKEESREKLEVQIKGSHKDIKDIEVAIGRLGLKLKGKLDPKEKKRLEGSLTDKKQELIKERKNLKQVESKIKVKQIAEIQDKIKEQKKLFGKVSPEKRREIANNINELIKKLRKASGKKTFTFIPPKGKKPKGRPRLPGPKAPKKPKKQREVSASEAFKTAKALRGLRRDFIPTMDLVDYGEVTTFEGYFTQAGPFPYIDEEGNEIIKIKDYDNLKEVFGRIAEQKGYIYTIGSKGDNSHLDLDERINGYASNFKFIDPNTPGIYGDDDIYEYGRIWGNGAFLDNIQNLSDLRDPKELNVSIGFEEEMNGNIQLVKDVYHIASSMNNTEIDRCRRLGNPCTFRMRRADFLDHEYQNNVQKKRGDHMITDNEQINSFRVFCKENDLLPTNGNITPKSIAAGKKSNNPIVKKYAELAQTLGELRPKKKKIDFTFDLFEEILKNISKIKNKEENSMKGKKKDLTEDQMKTKEARDPAEFTNEQGEEHDDCMQSGKTAAECTETLKRTNMDGKRDAEMINNQSGKVIPPDLSTIHKISKDMTAELEELRKMRKELAPMLEAKKLKEQKDFDDIKKALKDTYDGCPDFIKTLDFSNAKIILDFLERSNLVKNALVYKETTPLFSPISVTDMTPDERSKKMDDEFGFLNLNGGAS